MLRRINVLELLWFSITIRINDKTNFYITYQSIKYAIVFLNGVAHTDVLHTAFYFLEFNHTLWVKKMANGNKVEILRKDISNFC